LRDLIAEVIAKEKSLEPQDQSLNTLVCLKLDAAQ